MKLKDLRKVYEGRICVFNYNEESVYDTETGNKYCDKKYDIKYLDNREVLEMHSNNNVLQVKILA